ncbi:hypothetical protein HYH03_012663 [Edaphochlamys debaryana]|uniref:CP-type G domain-containing protein n=1 Tax=Edaphochlamys debaryana TaxID=47281 RepID=A0A835XRF5_9CHLO|nr:hypothetical protein HYH03_012663 [Edaphochlamys debaryana]|eukprot:KAG2488868.1 hypothetical protein HYH03_012663 [Edaphochlamys debaryana]
MGRHNGRARKAGEKVGAKLAAKNKKIVPKTQAGIAVHLQHTTDLGMGRNMQSVLDRSDLDELMAMADLADRDFTAERGQAVVISAGGTGVKDALAEAKAAEERAEAEARNAHRLALPRRPPWDADTSPEQLDLQERTMFLSWRRNLAQMEETEKLMLTPFEKNLEVWRQLWRVLERSDIVVQVVDARDPLLYRSEDLESYARELHPDKASLLLLNKADLLPPSVRRRWADYFDKAGVKYAFWSAYSVIQEQQHLRSEASALGVDVVTLKKLMAQQKAEQEQERARAAGPGPGSERSKEEEEAQAVRDDPRIKVLDVDELLALFERMCSAAFAAGVREAGASKAAAHRANGAGAGGSGAGEDGETSSSGSDSDSDSGSEDSEPGARGFMLPGHKHMVGLVGYPNVGKSSTINAIFGAKKTAVAPTPGKTKHFQTLHVSPAVVLCDCPGLVMPKFAKSRAEMVAAGVVPIDRLTDIRHPVDVVAARVGRAQLMAVYNIKLPPPAAHLPADSPPTAEQALRAFAMLRGWTIGMGLPDETRAGRQILRDYTNGKLVYCLLPPGSPQIGWVPAPADAAAAAGARRFADLEEASCVIATAASASAADAPAASAEADGDATQPPTAATSAPAAPAPAARPAPDLDAADLDLMEGLGLGPKGSKQKRPEYKFQKKAARSKGDRGQLRAEGAYDGAAMVTGKKGGLVRVGGV